MPDALEKIKSKITKGRGNQGFTLVETLIAGLLLTLVMTAVGRLSLSAMAGSSNLAERRRVEAAIDNHIQLIQQADSLLTYDSLPSNHRTGEEGSTRACRNPAQYLAKALEQKGLINAADWKLKPESDSIRLFDSFEKPTGGETSITTTYNYDDDRAIVSINYSFEAPESNIGIEQRSLELSPNFQSYCTPYESL